MHTCKTPSTPDAPNIEGVSPLDYRKQKSTLGFARKEPHDCGLLRPAGAGSRDLLAMTSHNGCTKQRRLILPLSASGVLRQGRCPALRSGAICCIELCDVMPSPKRGQVPRHAANHPAMRFGHERPCIVACRSRRRVGSPGSPFGLPSGQSAEVIAGTPVLPWQNLNTRTIFHAWAVAGNSVSPQFHPIQSSG